MKVSGKVTRESGGVKAARATPAAGGFTAGQTGSAAASPGTSASAAASPLSSVAGLEALIALQADGGGRGRAVANGQRMLALLETIQAGLLSGRFSPRDLESLARFAGAKYDVADASLAALHDQIALRARVELAKLGR